MKTMSVLLSFGLLFAASQLASRLKRAGTLPPERNQPAAIMPANANDHSLGFSTPKLPADKRNKA